MDIVIDKKSIYEFEYEVIVHLNYLEIKGIAIEHMINHLKDVLSFFEDIEDYEKCSKLKLVLDKLLLK